MAAQKRARTKKYFTAAEANALLPLLRSILRDVTDLARDLRDRHERLARLESTPRDSLGQAYKEELQQIEAEFEHDQERMREYEAELKKLGVELKDYYTGLVDFLCRMDGRDVYLCWRLGEPDVAHWHELDAGFAGRRKLLQDTADR
jgi:hypothetical protein